MPIFVEMSSIEGNIGKAGTSQVYGMRLGSQTLTPATVFPVISIAQVQGFEYGMEAPYDQSGSGGATGKRRHGPIAITREVDQASPLLFQMACVEEALQRLNLNFYTTNAQGEQPWLTITLTNAAIAGIRRKPHPHPSPHSNELEEFELTFDKIDVTYAGRGGMSDGWTKHT